jgi:hypothetical protein
MADAAPPSNSGEHHMADSENTSSEETSGDADVLVPAETWTQEDAPVSAAPAVTEQTPFRDDQLLFFEGAPIRDELADAQADPEAARSLAARHWSRLLYDPNRPWRGQTPYPQIGVPTPDQQGR